MIGLSIFVDKRAQKDPWGRIRCGMGHLSRALTLALLRDRKNKDLQVSFHLNEATQLLKEQYGKVSILTNKGEYTNYDLVLSGVNARVYRDSIVKGQPLIDLKASPVWKEHYYYLTHGISYVLSRSVLVFRRPFLDPYIKYEGGYFYTSDFPYANFSTLIAPSVEQEYTTLYLYGGAQDGIDYLRVYQKEGEEKLIQNAFETISAYFEIPIDLLKESLVSYEYINWGQECVDSVSLGNVSVYLAGRKLNGIATNKKSRILTIGESLQPFGGWLISAVISAYESASCGIEILYGEQLEKKELFPLSASGENMNLYHQLMAEEYRDTPQKIDLNTFPPLIYESPYYSIKVSEEQVVFVENQLDEEQRFLIRKWFETCFRNQDILNQKILKPTDHLNVQASFFSKVFLSLTSQERRKLQELFSLRLLNQKTVRQNLFEKPSEWLSYLCLMNDEKLSFYNIRQALTASYGSYSQFNPLQKSYTFKKGEERGDFLENVKSGDLTFVPAQVSPLMLNLNGA